MKDRVKVSLVQFAPEWLETTKNSERMRDYAIREAEDGADLIVFPETSTAGHITPMLPGEPIDFPGVTDPSQFFRKYVEASEPVPGPTTDALSRVAQKCGVYIIFGMSQLHPTIPATLYNAAVLIGPQGPIGVHYKMHLVMNEKHYFYPGRMVDVYHTELGNIGMMVCYDAYFPELARSQALKGAEILCSVFNGPRVPGVNSDGRWFRRLACVRARENTVYFLACLRAGKQGGYTYIGHSAIASPMGRSLAFAETDKETVVRAELTREELVEARGVCTVFRDRRPELYGPICESLDEYEEREAGSKKGLPAGVRSELERQSEAVL